MRQQAETYLKKALNDSAASFRDGQWESIEQLLNRKRVLVVQRTGWGKSMVYFLATKLLRDQDAGPTLLISPLLSLMRNQIEAAERIGIRACRITSDNPEEWNKIQHALRSNQVDVLLIAPERLANNNFRESVLARIANNIGLFVIDEAHCISDWGHDFRPEYRLIEHVLGFIPSNVPVLGTTATANDRVVDDVRSQLGQDIILQRGPLVRKSLKLQNISNMPSQAARMAWLAQIIPTLPGSGIVYTLTKRDAEQVAEWLRINNIDAEAYHAGISDREELEQQLLSNEIKVLVATVALGMGFDKPDLGFVVHFQRPSSVVHYYQQVGRAGRAVDEAYGILLCGAEDENLADYFIREAFPLQQHITTILRALDESDNGLTCRAMEHVLNLTRKQIYKAIKFLTFESPSPITYIDSNWQVTAAAATYQINQARVDNITATRRKEQAQMRAYIKHTGCLMAFLQDALHDPSPTACGQCGNCNPALQLSEFYDRDLARRGQLFLQKNYQPLPPIKEWPESNIFTDSPLSGDRSIPQEQWAEEGRALSLWHDAGWGTRVKQGKYRTSRFADELVVACEEMLVQWSPNPAPQWVTCIPSLNHPDLVPDFAIRLANALGLPFVKCIEKVRTNDPQKSMENNYWKVKNLDGVFKIHLEPRNYSPCLLIDDVVDFQWTFTVVSALLRQAGCPAVYPVALALTLKSSRTG